MDPIPNSPTAAAAPPRKRVSKACDRCRRRKDKCDGAKPICSTCLSSSAPCSYNPLSKKRGLPDGYVRGLEKICGAMIREVAGIEELILKRLEGEEEYWEEGDREGRGRGPLEVWKRSRLVRGLEGYLPVLEALGKKGRKRNWDEVDEGVVSHSPPSSGPLVPALGQEEVPTVTVSQECGATESRPPEPLQSLLATVSPVNDFPPNAGRLVEAYFSYTHIWLPIIERHDLLRVLYLGPSKNKLTSSPGETAALWAIIAYADTHCTIISTNEEYKSSSADLFYEKAKNLIHLVDCEFELGHVQASLILALLKVGKGDWDGAWMLVGHAVRIAISLGLDLIPSPSTISRRKHAFLGCFVLDTIIAARLGRHPHLRSLDVERVGTIDEEGLEEWDHWNDCLGLRRDGSPSLYQATTLSAFNKLVQLVKILNDIICFDDARHSNSDEAIQDRRDTPSEKLSAFHNKIEASLEAWKTSQDPSDENLSLPNQCNLHLTYLTVVMAWNLHHPPTSKTSIAHSGQKTIQWLKSYSDHFSLAILPPIYEYSLKLAGTCISHGIDTNHDPATSWVEAWQRVSAALRESWPVFQLQSDAMNVVSTSLDISGLTGQLQPRGDKEDGAGIVLSPPPPRSSNTHNPDHWPASSTTHPPQQTDLQQPLTSPRIFIAPSPPSLPQTQPQVSGRPSTIDSSTPSPALLDPDDIFNEFDAMDANLWPNTWEQSLINLGFAAADGEGFDEEFYAFLGDGVGKGGLGDKG